MCVCIYMYMCVCVCVCQAFNISTEISLHTSATTSHQLKVMSAYALRKRGMLITD